MQFQFQSLSDFLAMGNYGFYVWLSYALSVAAVGILIWQSVREPKQVFKQVKKAQARRPLSE